MLIDFHAHIGRLRREAYPEQPPLTPAQLVDRMNRDGIAQAVLLPLESPEGGWGYSLTEDAVAARDEYPERFIAFVCVDPRYPNACEFIEYHVTRNGCRGFGEHVNGLPFDDPLNMAIYEKCDELALPLVFEISSHYCMDDVGLPRLEKCLRAFPNITWVGHGPAWWSAISADDPRGGYPPEPIQPGGALDRLLSEYGHLYADLSAGSGWNAIARDPDFFAGFIGRHWRKLLFGTDIVYPNQDLPQVAWFHQLELSAEMREAIGAGNARRVLSLDSASR